MIRNLLPALFGMAVGDAFSRRQRGGERAAAADVAALVRQQPCLGASTGIVDRSAADSFFYKTTPQWW